jgi:hypothetical protein
MGSFTTPSGTSSVVITVAPSPSATVVTEQAFGQASSAGSSADYSRGDHTHGTPANPAPTASGTVISETAFGQAANAGAAATFSRGDHTHGTPSLTAAVSVVTEQAFGQASAVGVSTNYARQDHTHGTPATPTTGITRQALPAPYVNDWANEPNIDDLNCATFAEATAHNLAAGFTKTIGYDLGAVRSIIVGSDSYIEQSNNGGLATNLYLEYSCDGANWYQNIAGNITLSSSTSARYNLNLTVFARYIRVRFAGTSGAGSTNYARVFELTLFY